MGTTALGVAVWGGFEAEAKGGRALGRGSDCRDKGVYPGVRPGGLVGEEWLKSE